MAVFSLSRHASVSMRVLPVSRRIVKRSLGKKEQMGSNWYSAKSVIIWYGIAQHHFARSGMVKSLVYIPYLVWYWEKWIATLLVVKTK
ncbi:hypothetical protein [Thalassospira profundimaris]|uniref:hypothetical protein n=1 Tax=Thalassospira profundimaris TaxID=502049 RepID=UPI0011BEFB9F|nr:hypothetical protein [Thalassospira profundimaris]